MQRVSCLQYVAPGVLVQSKLKLVLGASEHVWHKKQPMSYTSLHLHGRSHATQAPAFRTKQRCHIKKGCRRKVKTTNWPQQNGHQTGHTGFLWWAVRFSTSSQPISICNLLLFLKTTIVFLYRLQAVTQLRVKSCLTDMSCCYPHWHRVHYADLMRQAAFYVS